MKISTNHNHHFCLDRRGAVQYNGLGFNQRFLVTTFRVGKAKVLFALYEE